MLIRHFAPRWPTSGRLRGYTRLDHREKRNADLRTLRELFLAEEKRPPQVANPLTQSFLVTLAYMH
jgi:hypothetical protein